MENEIQNTEIIIAGELGEVTVAATGASHKIIGSHSNNGNVTLTLAQVVDYHLNGESKTEDADFEIIEPKQLMP